MYREFVRDVLRLGRLLVNIARSSSSPSSMTVRHLTACPTSPRTVNHSSLLQGHHHLNTSRLTVSDPYLAPLSRPWYRAMLANSVRRPPTGHDQRGSKYGLLEVPSLATSRDHLDDSDPDLQTASNSTSDSGGGVFGGKLAQVQLVLVVMDALLVLHRLTILSVDVASLIDSASSCRSSDVTGWSSERQRHDITTDESEMQRQSQLHVGDDPMIQLQADITQLPPAPNTSMCLDLQVLTIPVC